MQDFWNRVKKKWKQRTWWESRQITAYRLYDHDIPEYPFYLDIYGDYLVFYDKRSVEKDLHLPSSEMVYQDLLGLGSWNSNQIIYKRRKVIANEHFSREDAIGLWHPGLKIEVQEGPQLRYWVNLTDYLDTGLFLDHRPLRQQVVKSAGIKKRFLNLFCYTGSMTVAAAVAGYHTTSVDLSKTYLDWLQDNLVLNNIDPINHDIFTADITHHDFLRNHFSPHSFDFIFLDPPIFSNSKKMESHFDVLEHHSILINNVMNLLKKDGVLIFSANKKKFQLKKSDLVHYDVKDITEKTIPRDFVKNRKVHHAYEFRHVK